MNDVRVRFANDLSPMRDCHLPGDLVYAARERGCLVIARTGDHDFDCFEHEDGCPVRWFSPAWASHGVPGADAVSAPGVGPAQLHRTGATALVDAVGGAWRAVARP